MTDSAAKLNSAVGSKAAALARVADLERDASDLYQGSLSSQERSLQIPIPEGFIIGVAACREFLNQAAVHEPLQELFQALEAGRLEPQAFSFQAQLLIATAPPPLGLEEDLAAALDRLQLREQGPALLALRSSATCEDLSDASFAGQFESFLSVSNFEQALDTYRSVISSLFSIRVVAYCKARKQSLAGNLMAVIVQQMVRSDLGASGVLLSSDLDLQANQTHLLSQKEFRTDITVTSIEACWGVGDALVGGQIIPERYEVENQPTTESGPAAIRVYRQQQLFKSDGSAQLQETTQAERTSQILTTAQILLLNSWGRRLQQSYHQAVDMEWALDGVTDQMVLVQVRPLPHGPTTADNPTTSNTELLEPHQQFPKPLSFGVGIGSGTVEAPVCVLTNPYENSLFRQGDVLVTRSTDPSWLPLMLQASALITEQGGRNSHAAILSRELGLLCIVGCADATTVLQGVEHVRLVCKNGVGEVTDVSVSPS